MVLLYAVPDHLDKVVFDLSWGYPTTGRDFLDACADIFKGQEWIGFVDFDAKKLRIAPEAVVHSGDMMDDYHRRGHHVIKVSLKKIPARVTHIFFTLCTWKSPTISRYPNPSMKFYEESNPSHMLCTEQISKAGNRQAIVMCSLMRSGSQWLVHSNGTPSDGNNFKYEPILLTVQKLIAKTGNYPYVPFTVSYGRYSSRWIGIGLQFIHWYGHTAITFKLTTFNVFGGGLIEGFHVTSLQQNLTSHPAHSGHVGSHKIWPNSLLLKLHKA